jgi:pyruvate, orthophosphate dikinase
MAVKFVYFFGKGKAEGKGNDKMLLGGKGAGLAEMTNIGLPVPAGFTITTEACRLYYEQNRRWPTGMDKQIKENLAKLEKTCKKKLGDSKDPCLSPSVPAPRPPCPA